MDTALPAHEQRRIDGSIWFLIALAATFLGLRLYCRLRRRKSLWWDDWILIVSWFTVLAGAILNSIVVSKLQRSPPADAGEAYARRIETAMLNHIMGTFFFVGAVWSKTAVAVMLLQIAGPKLKRLLWVIAIIMNVVVSISLVIRWTLCTPVEKIFDMEGVEGHCFDKQASTAFSIFSAVQSVVADFVLAFLPWPVLLKLNMKTSEKIGAGVAMSIGVVAGATGIVKIVKLRVITGDEYPSGLDFFELAIWSVAEIATTIIAASIPLLRVLLRQISGSSGCPVSYVRDLSWDVSSKVKSHYRNSHSVVVSSTRMSKSGCSSGRHNTPLIREESDDARSDEDMLNAVRGPDAGSSYGGDHHGIMKMEEIHIQYGPRDDLESGGDEIIHQPDRHSRMW